jgi:thioredoxin reductase (NADPH)
MELNKTQLINGQTTGSQHEKVLILGSGPAGLSAALYAARADLAPVVLTGMALGGQVSLTYMVENYPGFPDGICGQELVTLFQKQAERFGARVVFDTATEVDLSQRPFQVRTYNTEYLAETLIISTGAISITLGIPGEKELTGRGVSYCATCDGRFFKDKEVVVVGGGDSALEEGIFLSRYAKSVTLIHRRNSLRAAAILQDRASSQPKLHYIWDTVVTEVLGEDTVRALRLKNTKTGENRDFPTDGLFVFIGHQPNTELFKNQLELDERGYLKTDMTMETNIPGVFVAGEAGDPYFRQVITSAGMGAAAAMQAIRYIESHSTKVASHAT